MIGVNAQEGEALTQCSGVVGALKSNQGSVQALRLPIGFALLPVAGVRGETVGEFMVAPVLRRLIGVITAVAASEAGV